MAWSDYPERYNTLPVWLRVLLFPILVPVILVPSMVVMAFVVVFFLPFFIIKGWIENRRFWRKLRDRGQVAEWSDVETQIASGSGTLIVEVAPKGPACSWLIDVPRDMVDPEHILPSWQEFEDQGWEVFQLTPARFESINRWTMEHLGRYESSARALRLSWQQLDELAVTAKQQSSLAVVCWCEGCLTSRIA